MTYRIIQTPRGFIVQHRFLWKFWINCSEPYYRYDRNYTMLWRFDKNTVWVYPSYESAKNALARMKQYPIYYKGHKITYGYWNGKIVYVDLTSRKHNYRFDETGYTIASYDYDGLKETIDNFIYEKEKKKNENKILKIFKDND